MHLPSSPVSPGRRSSARCWRVTPLGRRPRAPAGGMKVHLLLLEVLVVAALLTATTTQVASSGLDEDEGGGDAVGALGIQPVDTTGLCVQDDGSEVFVAACSAVADHPYLMTAAKPNRNRNFAQYVKSPVSELCWDAGEAMDDPSSPITMAGCTEDYDASQQLFVISQADDGVRLTLDVTFCLDYLTRSPTGYIKARLYVRECDWTAGSNSTQLFRITDLSLEKLDPSPLPPWNFNTQPPLAAPLIDGSVTITPPFPSSLCVQNAPLDGATVFVGQCASASDHPYRLTLISDGEEGGHFVRVVSVASKQCWDAHAPPHMEGPLTVSECSESNENQLFLVTAEDVGRFKLAPKSRPDLCLDFSTWSPTGSLVAPVYVRPCTEDPLGLYGQLFNITIPSFRCKPGIALTGTQLASSPVRLSSKGSDEANSALCQQICAADPACKGYYYKTTHLCYLMSNVTAWGKAYKSAVKGCKAVAAVAARRT